MADAANDGLPYPKDFQEFFSLMDRWHRARGHNRRPGETLSEWLGRTAEELDDVVNMAKQVWENAERGRPMNIRGHKA